MFDQWLPIRELVASVQSGKTSAVSLVTEAIKRAKAAKDYNAILSIPEERALQRASQIDADIKAGKSVGDLAGVPFVAKDP